VPVYSGVTWGQHLWCISLIVLGISSLMGSINFITTVINMRAPGMSWFRLPLVIWSLFITAVLLVILGVASRSVWADIKQHVPPSDVFIQVTAKQFNWEIAYPGLDGKIGTEDDVTVDNEVHVPVDKTVRLLLKSRDVIHSFFIPQARFKQDLVPGHEIPAWFKILKPGDYEIPCAELCGFGHSGMRGWLHVLPQAEYDAWVRETKAAPIGAAAAKTS
jgi:cytochrome c oxidase subunit 2